MQCQKLKTYMETGRVMFLPARAIRPNPAQPRKIFREEQLRELAENILQEKSRVVKKLMVENINGEVLLLAGNSIWLEIPDLAEISLKGMALVEGCTHIFEDGEHRTRLEISIEEE